MTSKFGMIHFSRDTVFSCCGQMVIYDMSEGSVVKAPWDTTSPKTFDSAEEQFADFTSRVYKYVEEDTEEYNEDFYAHEEKVDCCYGFMTMTLIKGPKPQIPEFIERLLKDGWQCDQEVRNPKTDNIIVHLSKAL